MKTLSCLQMPKHLIAAAVYAMSEVIIRFNTQPGNIFYQVSDQGKEMLVMKGGMIKRVCKHWESLWFSFGFMFIFWVYDFPLGIRLNGI